MGSEIETDAWLRQALRHAPDAGLAPPAALREAILAQARSGVAGAGARRPPRGWLAAGWAWLARPSAAAGFAGVMVSTVVGLLWWSGSYDDAARHEPRREAPAAVPVPARPGASASDVSAAAGGGAAAQPESQVAPLSAASVTPPAQTEPREARREERRARLAAAAPSTAERTAAEAVSIAPALPVRPAQPAEAPPVAAAAPQAEPPAATQAQEPAAATAAPPRRADAPAGAEAARKLAEPRLANRPPALGLSRSAAALAPASQPDAALHALAGELAAGPDAWRWAWAGRPHTHGSAQQAWFDELLRLTADRWQAADAVPRNGPSVRLFDGSGRRAEFLVTDRAVVWTDAAQRRWQAALDPADAAHLQAMGAGW